MALADNIVSVWQFESDLTDEVGSNDVYSSYQIHYATGKFGNALSLVASEAPWLLVANDATLTFSADFSVNVWIKPTDLTGQRYIVYKRDHFGIYIQGSDLIFWYEDTGSTITNVYDLAETNLTTDWQMITATYNDSTHVAKLYIDNVEVATATGSASPSTSTYPVSIGCQSDSVASRNYCFNGLIDDLIIWKGKCLTTAEIGDLYSDGSGWEYPFVPFASAGTFESTGTLSGTPIITALGAGAFESTGELSGSGTDGLVKYFYTAISHYYDDDGNEVYNPGGLAKVTVDGVLIWELIQTTIDAGYTNSSLWGFAVDNSGNVYLIGGDREHIHKILPDGSVDWTFNIATGAATSIAVDPDGTYVYVANDYNSAQLTKIDASDGSEITSGNWPLTSTTVQNGNKLLYGRDGYLYITTCGPLLVTNSGIIQKINPDDGAVSWTWRVDATYNRHLYDFDVNASGTMIAIHNGNPSYTVSIVGSDGVNDRTWDADAHQDGMKVSIDDDGNAYLTSGSITYPGVHKCDTSTTWPACIDDTITTSVFASVVSVSPDGEEVYLSTGGGTLNATLKLIDPDTGNEIWEAEKIGVGTPVQVPEDTLPTWGITVASYSNGSVQTGIGTEVTGQVLFPAGEDITLSFEPDAGYLVGAVSVDSVGQGVLAEYEFTAIDGQHTIDVDFAQGVSAGTFESTGELSAYINQSLPAGTFESTGELSGDMERSISAGTFESTGTLSGDGELLDLTNAIELYIFVLTGANDSLADLEIDISSFQLRQYIDGLSYLSVVTPRFDLIDEITDRSNGTLELYIAYANLDLTEIVRNRIIETAFDLVPTYQGVVNQSITLSGNETTAMKNARLANAKTLTLDNGWFNYIGTSGGLTTARMTKPHLSLYAGDTVVMESGSIEVGRLSWTLSESYQQIEIAEAAA